MIIYYHKNIAPTFCGAIIAMNLKKTILVIVCSVKAYVHACYILPQQKFGAILLWYVIIS